MGYKVTTNPHPDIEQGVMAITTHDVEDITYAVVVVEPSDGFERNAVRINTAADDAQVYVDERGNGMVRDDVGRALSAALAMHYTTKDGVIVGGRFASEIIVERVRAYVNRCAVTRVEPSTAGLMAALDGPTSESGNPGAEPGRYEP